MASPFRLFRRYQKTLLAIALILLMFVFVVGDSLVSYLGGGGNARASEEHDAKATAVHWDGGKLSNLELRQLVSRRLILNSFLKNVEMEGTRPSAVAGVDPPELRVQRLLGPETPQQRVEASVVRSKLLADAARDSGMKVSKDTLLQYLSELGRKNVSAGQMRDMLKSRSMGGNSVSPDYVLDALRDEMLAHNYLISHEFAFETVTPQQRWKDWMRVNDRVVVEAAAVPAEMYMVDVKKPTKEELTPFFNDYKDREAMPDFYGNAEMPSATPGFRIPRKIDLQFIEASYDEFLAKAEAKVSDEEVAKYYEEHKDLFPKTNVGLTEDKSPKKEDAPKSDAPKSDAPKSDAPKSDAPKSDAPKSDAPKSDEPATKTDSKDGAEPKSSEPAEKKTESPEKKDAPPAANDEKSDGKSSDAKKSSAHPDPTKSVFRLTAFAQDAEKKEEKADKAAEKPSETPAAKTDTETKPAPPAEKTATTTPAAEPPAAPPAAAPDATKAAPATPAEAPPKKPVEYQPLSEVKDQIRKRLAEGKVAEELSKLTGDIQGLLVTTYDKWRFPVNELSDAEKKEHEVPPKSLTDFAAMAEKSGLKSGKTGLKTLLELRNLPVGKSTAIDANQTLMSMLFVGNDLEMFQPVKTVDIDGNRFIVMKIGDAPGKVPTLDEVKNEVEKAWMERQAAEQAKKHADEFAKKAEEAKTPLASFFADNKSIKVVRTDPFSELTGGEASFVGGQIQQSPYRFSQPSEIVAAGPDFLRGVFNLKDGQVGVLPNNDHSIYYVVRVVEHQPALPELRNAYMAEAFSWTGENVMNQIHRREVASNLEQDIEVSTNLKWDREPDKASNEQRDEG